MFLIKHMATLSSIINNNSNMPSKTIKHYCSVEETEETLFDIGV